MTSQRRFGTTTVSAVGLGAMPLSLRDGGPIDHDRAVETIHAALDAGITLLDTADIYAPSWDTMGHNEALIATALQSWPGDRGRVVVATKGGIRRGPGESWGRDGSYEYLRERVEKALVNLKVDSLDLFCLHRPDRTRTFAAQVEALQRLQDEGLVTSLGVSNANVEEIAIAVEVLGEGGLAAVQNEFSPRFNQTSLDELRFCGEHGIAFVAYSPLGQGNYAKSLGERFEVIAETARRHGVTPQQVTLAWELALGEHVIVIPGATRPASAIDSAAAMTLSLDADEVAAISRRLLASEVVHG
ncbi:aldo/keto reductase [Propionibacteriaceae bacterium Y1923]